MCTSTTLPSSAGSMNSSPSTRSAHPPLQTSPPHTRAYCAWRAFLAPKPHTGTPHASPFRMPTHIPTARRMSLVCTPSTLNPQP
eukprot:3941420-Rhodomonas_salina.1